MRNCLRSLPSVFALVLVILFSSAVSRADVTGSIQGVVRDKSQAVVAGAHITVTNLQTNFKQEATSSADGTYRILALPPGSYTLSVNAGGFRTFVETDVVVKVNDKLEVDVTLEVGSVQQETVKVEANAVQVQTESTQLGDVIDSKKMLALPLNGRSYIDLLGLQAGVAPGTAQTIQQDRPVSGNLNPGNISVNGQRETANAFLVNGGDVSEGRNLGAGLVPNLDSVEEFRLITNSFDAEYGKFSGAVMNAITKSGTNGFHGDAFEFLRNDAVQVRIAAQSIWLCSGWALLEEQDFLVLRLSRHEAGGGRGDGPCYGTNGRPASGQHRPCEPGPERPERHLSGPKYN